MSNGAPNPDFEKRLFYMEYEVNYLNSIKNIAASVIGVDPTVVSPGAIWTAADGSDRAELFRRRWPMPAFRSQRPRLEPRNRRMAHIVGAGDLGQCLTAVASFHRLAFLVRRELRRTAEPHAAGLGSRTALTGPGADQVAFELGQPAEHGQHEAAMGRGGIGPAIPQ